jgi:hypothetical protein
MSAAQAQLIPSTHEHSTPYDEFNTVISKEIFPATGMTARAAQAIVNSFAWTDANPELNLSSLLRPGLSPRQSKSRERICTRTISTTICTRRCT